MTLHAVRDAISLRINAKLFYGWLMVGVGALGMFASGPGQSHTFSVFITPISEDLDISRTSLSSAYASATLLAAFGLPYVGRLIDRFGVRCVMTTVTLLFSMSTIAFGAVSNLVFLALGFGALRFLGQGSLMLNCTNLVAQWFSRRRGIALSIMALGFSLSMAIHPALAQWLTDQVGWREAWIWLGIVTGVLLLPVVIALVQNKPEDMGLLPDGAASSGFNDKSGVAVELQNSVGGGLTLSEAMRTPAFWIIAVSLSILSMLVTGMFFHQVSIFENHGLRPQIAAQVFAVSAISMVTFMPLLGHMLDRFPTKRMFAGALLTMSIASVSLIFVTDVASAITYSVIFGLANAAIHTHMTYLWPRFFGRRYLGSIQGAAQTVGVVGASMGPLPLGIAFDVFGSYSGALFLLAGLPVICATLVLFLKPPKLPVGRSP